MANSKQKGKRGELELAKRLSALFGCDVRRGQQYSGLEGKDVVGVPGVHVECKRLASMSVRLDKAMAQSTHDAHAGEVPVVAHRSDNADWQLTMWLADVPKFVERIYLLLASEGCDE